MSQPTSPTFFRILRRTFFKVGLFFQTHKNAWEGTKNAVVWRTAMGVIFNGGPPVCIIYSPVGENNHKIIWEQSGNKLARDYFTKQGLTLSFPRNHVSIEFSILGLLLLGRG